MFEHLNEFEHLNDLNIWVADFKIFRQFTSKIL